VYATLSSTYLLAGYEKLDGTTGAHTGNENMGGYDISNGIARLSVAGMTNWAALTVDGNVNFGGKSLSNGIARLSMAGMTNWANASPDGTLNMGSWNIYANAYYGKSGADTLFGVLSAGKKYAFYDSSGNGLFSFTNSNGTIKFSSGLGMENTTNALTVSAGTNLLTLGGSTGPIMINGSSVTISNQPFSMSLSYGVASNATNEIVWSSPSTVALQITNLNWTAGFGNGIGDVYISTNIVAPSVVQWTCATGLYWGGNGTAPSNLAVTIPVNANVKVGFMLTNGVSTNCYLTVQGK
jgi:hypothetical protein